MTNRIRLGALAAMGLAGLFAGCNNDPIPQSVLDGLPEESGSPSAAHRPGQPCLVCHTSYEGASPELALGGTLFKLDANAPGGIAPAPGILVTVFDSTGDSRPACTNVAGNFHIPKENWADLTFPLKVRAGKKTMKSIIGRDGSCASCHKLPSADRPGTGEGRDSAGIVLVDEEDIDPTCGGGAP
jgi:mono/diheme cytochrome c family protein